MSIVNDLNDSDADALLTRLDEYQKSGVPVAQAQRMAVADILAEAKADHAEMMDLAKGQHPDAFEEAKPEVKASTERVTREPTDEQVADERVGISHTLMALGAKGWLYESPVSTAKSVAAIARDKGVTKVREDDIGGGVKEWKVTLPDAVDTDTGKSKPGRSAYLRQKGNELWIDAEITGEGSGGSKLYDIGFNYAHNNGLVFIGDRNGFSKVAIIRRLENMISAAIKYGSTDFMAPHAKQVLGSDGVPGLRWEKGDTLGNLRRMIDVSRAAMQNKQPALAAVQYDRSKDSFTDSQGVPFGYDDLHDLAGAFRPVDGSGGAGVTTVQRSALYHSLLQSKGARLAFLDSVRGIPGTGGQGFGGALEGTHYSTERNTVSVDGVERSTVDDQGRSLAGDQDGIKNFWKWYTTNQNPRAVGEGGGGVQGAASGGALDGQRSGPHNSDARPIRLYHGTNADITAFEIGHPDSLDHGWLGKGVYLTDDTGISNWYSEDKPGGAPNSMPLYAAIVNPYVASVQDKKRVRDGGSAYSERWTEKLKAAGHDGVVLEFPSGGSEYVAFYPSQVKSATGNTGAFDGANPDIRASTVRATLSDIGDNVIHADLKSDFLSNVRDAVSGVFMQNTSSEVSAWGKTIGTPMHKAALNRPFALVFHGIQKFIEDTSLFGTKAEGLARSIFPGVELSWDAMKNMGLSKVENAKVGHMLAEGTLHEGLNPDTDAAWTDDELLATKLKQDGAPKQNPKTKQPWTAEDVRAEHRANPRVGKVFTDAELKANYDATDREVTAYHEARAALNQSLTDYGNSEMAQMARTALGGMDDVTKVAANTLLSSIVRGNNTSTQAAQQIGLLLDKLEAKGAKVGAVRTSIDKIAGDVNTLSKAGYSPLMRFGTWTVQGLDKNGDQVFFSMVQSKAEAERLRAQIAKDPEIASANFRQFTSEQSSVFQGMTAETAQMFAQHNGMDKSEAVQAFIQQVLSSRSVMQRMQKREGVAGYSHDATRTVASFLTGNSRKASSNLNMHAVDAAALSKELQGDYKLDAQKLVEYVKNPQEEAQKLRGLLFAQYLGGSIASGLVNLTQPVLMTFPYLSQFGAARAGAAMKTGLAQAISHLRGKEISDPELRMALEQAKADGILDPNEMFQLMGAAQQGAGSFGMQKFMRVWGMNFQLTEAYNRTATFIAAYETAKETLKTPEGLAQLQKAMNTSDSVTAVEFAAHAIQETQGVYNKGNRPNWARGAVGSTVFTFKQFSISYMEFLKRAWGDGLIPKQQFVIAIGMLMLASGVGGLPGADDLDDVIDTFGHLAGHATNSKKAKRDFLHAMLGKDFGDAMNDGISHWLPFDISGRVGAGNFLPATKILDPAQTAQQKLQGAMEIGGVAGSLVFNYINAIQAAAGGDYKKALGSVAPVAVANAYKGAEMMATGVYKDTSGKKVMDVSNTDGALKFIGIQPAIVADDSQANRIAQQDIGTQRWKQQAVSSEYAKALVDGDQDTLASVRKEIKEWNENNPRAAHIQLSMSSIQSQVKALRSTRDQRTVKNAPKGMRGDIQETVR
jgi:hypothetical protein